MRYKIRKRLLTIVTGIAGAAGLAVLGLTVAGPAVAATTPGVCVASTVATDTNCMTSASVQVGTTLTIADNTPSMSFGTGAVNAGSTQTGTVSYTVNSNDTNGAFVTVGVAGGGGNTCDFATGSNQLIPDQPNLTLQPNSTGPFVSGTCGGTADTYNSVTIPNSGVSNQVYTDTWQLVIPGSTVAGTYNATMNYILTGN